MGAARRRQLAGLRKFQPKVSPPPRTPEQLEEENRFYGTIGAAIDFIYVTSEDALRKQAQRVLALQSKP